MTAVDRAEHWRRLYEETPHDSVSWFEPTPAKSLELIEAAGLGPEAVIIDAGGGASRLAPELVARGYEDVTVADISPSALERARELAGAAATRITYLEADVTTGLERRYELWHDRAVFHFMVEPELRAAYVESLRAAVTAPGQVVIATFGPEGPTRCSGLPVARYDGSAIAAELGDGFLLLSEEEVAHTTPAGNAQQFVYARLQRSTDL